LLIGDVKLNHGKETRSYVKAIAQRTTTRVR
jgi:hypothetical protein